MANSTDEAVVVERGRAGIILQFSDGDEERYDEDDVELLAPTGDGLERAIPRTPRAPVREVVPVAQRIPPQKENARRAYAIAKHRVDEIKAHGTPEQAALADKKLEELMTDLGLLGGSTDHQNPQASSSCFRKLTDWLNSVVTWASLFGFSALSLCLVLVWSGGSVLYWTEPHEGVWSKTDCNITSLGLTNCHDIVSITQMMNSGVKGKLNGKIVGPETSCCSLQVVYIVKFNYKAGISIYNSTIAQPAKLSASRYEPDPCSLAEGPGRLCWYRYAGSQAEVETTELFQAANDAFPDHGQKMLAMLLPALHCQALVCVFMTAVSCGSFFFMVVALVWALINPSAILIRHGNVDADTLDEAEAALVEDFMDDSDLELVVVPLISLESLHKEQSESFGMIKTAKISQRSASLNTSLQKFAESHVGDEESQASI